MTWKKVEGFPDYRVSDGGQVKGRNGLLKGRISGSYVKVTLYRSGVACQTWVHRLVAIAFVGGYKPGLEVDHLNGVKDDNRACNLQWVTHGENLRRAAMTGWSRSPQAVVRDDGSCFPSIAAAARASDIAPVTVWKAANGLSKSPRIGFKKLENLPVLPDKS